MIDQPDFEDAEAAADPAITADADETTTSPEPQTQVEPLHEEEPATFERQLLAPTVRWVWMGGYLITTAVVTVAALQLDLFLLDTPAGLVPLGAALAVLAMSVWRLLTRYRNWTWQLTEGELIIDRGVIFKLTRIIPRVRVQHVDLSSGPLDRFFGLRQLAIYTAGTREADATIPGLTEARAEELRRALLGQ